MTVFDTNVKPTQIQREWFIVDAEGKVLGRLATQVVEVLRGKHKPYFSPQWDMGDYVIVVNAEKVQLTGRKEEGKVYYRYTGYPGGLIEETAGELRDRKPEELVIRAVKRMLPKNRLSRKVIKKLFVYSGPDHPHQAQEPKVLDIKA